jgi:hypothetical protein
LRWHDEPDREDRLSCLLYCLSPIERSASCLFSCYAFAAAMRPDRKDRLSPYLFVVFFFLPGRSPFFLRLRPLRLLDDKPNILVQHHQSRSSNSGGCFTLSNTRLSIKWSMEYLDSFKPTPPAMALIACNGLPMHSESDIPSAPAVNGLARPRSFPQTIRQSSNSRIWSSHLTLLHSRRHDRAASSTQEKSTSPGLGLLRVHPRQQSNSSPWSSYLKLYYSRRHE